MSDPDVPALARQLAARLRHLQEAHGVQYVPRIEAPSPPSPQRAVSTPSTTQTRSTPPVRPSSRRPAQRPPAGRAPTGGPAGVPAKHRPAPKVDAKAALRQQAQTWTPATKLEYLREKNVGDCRRCGLCQTRKNIVFGVGDPQARIMIVGEAPGADEDRTGEPFVGKAGKLLNRWLDDLGIGRGGVYIANVLKCRPPGNRDPKPQEVERCSPFLRAQIRAIGPAVVVGLGRHAGMLLSRRDDMSLRAMRGSRLEYDATSPKEPPRSLLIPLVVTYHPAYVLRQHGEAEDRATQMVMTDLRRALDMASGS